MVEARILAEILVIVPHALLDHFRAPKPRTFAVLSLERVFMAAQSQRPPKGVEEILVVIERRVGHVQQSRQVVAHRAPKAGTQHDRDGTMKFARAMIHRQLQARHGYPHLLPQGYPGRIRFPAVVGSVLIPEIIKGLTNQGFIQRAFEFSSLRIVIVEKHLLFSRVDR